MCSLFITEIIKTSITNKHVNTALRFSLFVTSRNIFTQAHSIQSQWYIIPTHTHRPQKIPLISHHKTVMDKLHRRDPNPRSRPRLNLVQLPLRSAWVGVCESTYRDCRRGPVSCWGRENSEVFFPSSPHSQRPLPGPFDLFLFYSFIPRSLCTDTQLQPTDSHTN